MSFTGRECWPGRQHQFDSASGWCAWGCGCRSDGRVTSRQGAVIYPGPPQPDHQQHDNDRTR